MSCDLWLLPSKKHFLVLVLQHDVHLLRHKDWTAVGSQVLWLLQWFSFLCLSCHLTCGLSFLLNTIIWPLTTHSLLLCFPIQKPRCSSRLSPPPLLSVNILCSQRSMSFYAFNYDLSVGKSEMFLCEMLKCKASQDSLILHVRNGSRKPWSHLTKPTPWLAGIGENRAQGSTDSSCLLSIIQYCIHF